MSDKDLNLFDDCAAERVYIYPQKEECTSSSWGHCKMYTPGTITFRLKTQISFAKLNEN